MMQQRWCCNTRPRTIGAGVASLGADNDDVLRAFSLESVVS